MTDYPALSKPLPVDSNGRRFLGASGRLLFGFQSPDDVDESILGIVLVDLNGDPILVTGAASGASTFDAGPGTNDEAIVAPTTGLRLMGFSCYETTGSAGSAFLLREGTSNAGGARYAVTLGPNESRGEWFGPDGIASPGGIWLERTTGDTQMLVHYKVVS